MWWLLVLRVLRVLDFECLRGLGGGLLVLAVLMVLDFGCLRCVHLRVLKLLGGLCLGCFECWVLGAFSALTLLWFWAEVYMLRLG